MLIYSVIPVFSLACSKMNHYIKMNTNYTYFIFRKKNSFVFAKTFYSLNVSKYTLLFFIITIGEREIESWTSMLETP